ncbi:hypothetical protein [Algoriphagus sp. NG3]|uniref:hypothetical protein n=1 Tax=Algoriphagus sp. NG3 TaxID=3097546 RepID=UPI002A7FE50B|nr:hypothetical protein [Algoriphagus sp. NG3]WPR73752.1 hypothetical protein SLW71_13795 [Algoriphagus sp. NG3]
MDSINIFYVWNTESFFFSKYLAAEYIQCDYWQCCGSHLQLFIFLAGSKQEDPSEDRLVAIVLDCFRRSPFSFGEPPLLYIYQLPQSNQPKPGNGVIQYSFGFEYIDV